MPRGPAYRIFAALVWTAMLGGVLHAVDRMTLGEPLVGWITPAEVEAIPQEAGVAPVPRYLPQALGWPPEVMRYRLTPDPGWWLGLDARDTGEPALWIGTGELPTPPEMGDLDACVAQIVGRRCPEPWRALSLERDGQTLHVVGRVELRELRRILEGLRPH